MNNRELSKISVMRALVKREFQEHRLLFVYFPVALALLNAVLILVVMVHSWFQDASVPVSDFGLMMGRGYLPGTGPGVQVDEPAGISALRKVVSTMVEPFSYFSGGDYMNFFWGVMLYYFLMTLYKQRQDRSILFWNSMPVSDAQTIISKWLAGMIGCQGIFLACLLMLRLLLLIGWLVYISYHRVPEWDRFYRTPEQVWHALAFFGWYDMFWGYLTLLITSLANLALTLPLYAWLLLASAWSRSMPFAWAAGPWVIVMGIELYLTKTYAIATMLLRHAMPLMFPPIYHTDFIPRLGELLTRDLAVSAVLGLVLVYAAIRYNRSEDV